MTLQKLLKAARRPLYITKLYREVTDYEILSQYLGFEPTINKAVHSVLRKSDETPSLIFFRPTKIDVDDEAIFFKDMATAEFGDTLTFVKKLLQFEENKIYSLKEVVEHIDGTMGLGLFGGEKKERVKLDYILPPKDLKPIFFQSRKYTTNDLEYWAVLGVDKPLLDVFDIRSLKYLLDDKGLVYREFPSNELAYVYVLYDKVKIYRPFADKLNKFRNNCPGDDYKYYQGYAQLQHYGKPGAKIIVTKSMKDVVTFVGMGMRNGLLLDAIAPHAESNYVNAEFLNWLCEKYEDVLVVSDFDGQGVRFTQDARKKNSKVRYKFLDTKRVMINNKLKVINKDVADSCLYRGLAATEKIFLSWYHST